MKMVSKGEIELIVDYALENESNLKIAVKVGLAFEEIRKRVIIDLLGTFENILKQSLDDPDQWIFNNEFKGDINANYRGFYIGKRSWKNNYQVGIQCQQSGTRKFVIGLGKNKMLSPIEGGYLKKQIDEQ